ncbi:DUF6264 family protein [Agromyces sp. NPDC057865]|uniref:DUF6264 family protein n=1 Tax=Agromyces sp. NPDC057865 TaxID=3346267 RepID=UPI00366DEAE0
MSDAVQPEPVQPPPVQPPPVQPPPVQPYDQYATAAPAKRPIIMWDLVTTIVLLVLMIGAALLASFLSFFLAFAGDSCGASSVCDYDRMATGMMVAMIGPLLVGLLALIAAIILLVLRRIAFWIPLLGILLIVGVFIGGFALTASGVVRATP